MSTSIEIKKVLNLDLKMGLLHKNNGFLKKPSLAMDVIFGTAPIDM